MLGSGYTASTASAIWTNGNITYVGGWALPLGSQYAGHAILWTIQQTPAPPPLLLQNCQSLHGTNVLILTWTNNCATCTLETTSVLPGTWSTVSTPRTTNANYVCTTVTNTASTQFYRLRGQ